MLLPIVAFLTSFAVGMILAPVLLWFLKKIKARQSILVYVTQHRGKEGIPTGGGLIFLLPLFTSLLFMKGQKNLAVFCLVITLTYGLVGLLDDGIKILFHRNLGLKAYQKIIAQLVIAVLGCYFCYKSDYIGTEIILPFSKSLTLSWWYIPFCIVLFIAMTNAVNLTDGLDGLAGSTVSVYFLFIGVILLAYYSEKNELGQTLLSEEYGNLLVFVASLVGGILAFLWKNVSKATVFMGDCGSLALGGACAAVPLCMKNPLLCGLTGIMFVVSVISVIVQVLVFKWKKKRVFLMAPFHHHLEMKGYQESKIVCFYCILTAVFGLVSIFFML